MNADGVNPWMLTSCNSNAKRCEIKTDPEQMPECVAHVSSESERLERSVQKNLC